MWLRRKQRTDPPKGHRGRIYRAGTWWRYKRHDCDYGAGTRTEGYAHEGSDALAARAGNRPCSRQDAALKHMCESASSEAVR